ncbi:MAG: TetR/AcrR family transcriptional regulator [Nitrospira sp.]|nr:TetR/AcrR family transcriptional regulator [Nitrospira sp.]
MSDIANAILDAAERRIRVGGFNGFSFREIAADVGIKSSSVHYHFPAKGHLAAAVTRRYIERSIERINEEIAAGADPIKVWIRTFRNTLHSEGHMCPCIALGADSRDLPTEAAIEVKQFFKTCLNSLITTGLSPNNAAKILSTITGALVIANLCEDLDIYDQATRNLLEDHNTLSKLKAKKRSPQQIVKRS